MDLRYCNEIIYCYFSQSLIGDQSSTSFCFDVHACSVFIPAHMDIDVDVVAGYIINREIVDICLFFFLFAPGTLDAFLSSSWYFPTEGREGGRKGA